MLAAYQASVAGGLAGGSYLWGTVAGFIGTTGAIACSGVAMLGGAAIGLWLRVPPSEDSEDELMAPLEEPEVGLAMIGRSGPIVVESEYYVEPHFARSFYVGMLEARRIRLRNGAYGWSLARDIAIGSSWVERFHCPTGHDYLRQRERERMTNGERGALQQRMGAGGHAQIRVRRLLERPLGYV